MKKAKILNEFTVCTECRFLLDQTQTWQPSDIWYNQLCTASPLPTARDPYDGQVKPYEGNKYYPKHFVSHRFSYCRDINKDGNCPKYKPKLGS